MSNFRRIIFLGSPDFAVPSLKNLIESEQLRPLLVITQPDKPAGRNMQLMPTPVKVLALQHGISVFQPEDINSAESVEYLQSLKPDMLVTVAFGQKLKKTLRDTAVHGAVNLHPSLLPQLRGAAPIPFALWQGLIQTGITIFKLTGRMDAGPIYFRKPLFIFPGENATYLAERLAYISSMCLAQFLADFLANPWNPDEQDEAQASYCRKLGKEDLIIDWNSPAGMIQNHILALSYQPGAYSMFRAHQFKILETELTDKISSSPAGSITRIVKNVGFEVQTGDGQLLVKQVQPSGKKIMSAWAYHLGAKLQEGERFG